MKIRVYILSALLLLLPGVSNAQELWKQSGASTIIPLTINWKVGIGTTTPGRTFAVNGKGLFSGDLSVAGFTATGTITTALSSGCIQSTAGVLSSTGSSCGSGGGGSLFGQTFEINASGNLEATTTSLAIQAAKMLVGTTTSLSALAVQGNALISGTSSSAFIVASGTAQISGLATLSGGILSNAGTSTLLGVSSFGFNSATGSNLSLSGSLLLNAGSSTLIGISSFQTINATATSLTVSGTATTSNLRVGGQSLFGQLATLQGGILVNNASSTILGVSSLGFASATGTNLSLSGSLILNAASSTLMGVSNFIGTTATVTDMNVTNLLKVRITPSGTPSISGDGIPTSGYAITNTGLSQFIVVGTIAQTTSNVASSFLSGSAALPGIAYIGDLNTGLARTAADNLALSTNGLDRLHVDANGFVGIATGTPGMNFSVHGDSLVSGTSSTANLTATGTLRFTSLATGCLQSTSGLISSTGSACGSGGGSSFGQSFEINASGNNESTTTTLALQSAKFLGGTTTAPLFTLAIQGDSLVSGTSTVGQLYATTSAIVDGMSRLNGGFTSTASSTVNNNLRVSRLYVGGAAAAGVTAFELFVGAIGGTIGTTGGVGLSFTPTGWGPTSSAYPMKICTNCDAFQSSSAPLAHLQFSTANTRYEFTGTTGALLAEFRTNGDAAFERGSIFVGYAASGKSINVGDGLATSTFFGGTTGNATSTSVTALQVGTSTQNSMFSIQGYKNLNLFSLAATSGQTYFTVANNGEWWTDGVAPTIGTPGCGSGAQVLPGSSDHRGVVRLGSSAGTQCSVAWPEVSTGRRSCVATHNMTANAIYRGIGASSTPEMAATSTQFYNANVWGTGDEFTYDCTILKP